MSTYSPRGGSLKAIKHEAEDASGPFWMIHDDHGEYDGPYGSQLDAVRQIALIENWHFDAEQRNA